MIKKRNFQLRERKKEKKAHQVGCYIYNKIDLITLFNSLFYYSFHIMYINH